MTIYISYDEVLKNFSPEDQAEIKLGTCAMILAYGISQIKGKDAMRLASDLKEFGANLFVRMPTGAEVEIPLPCIRA